MSVVWFSFFVHAAAETCQFPQPAQVSTASTGFRSYFVKICATGVL